MRSLSLAALLATGACQPPAVPLMAQTEPAPSTASAQPVAGAVTEPSGFWTVRSAPSSPVPPPQPRQPRPAGEAGFYAELAGVSNEEAQRRLAAQQALQGEMVRLMETLRAREAGNFLDAELVHRPDWQFLFYFRRAPEETLAKYTSHPRFAARQGGPYTESELRDVTQPWVDRLAAERLFTGYGLNTRLGRLDMHMVVSEAEFRRIAAARGWEPVPPTIRMEFTAAPAGPAVEASVAPGIRLFPQNDRDLGIIPMAGFYGRIELRDGCFYVGERLAYFPREVGLYRDPQGYLSLRNRAAGAPARHLGRIGEEFSWAGPLEPSENLPMVPELRQRCGAAPLVRLSIPEAVSLFHARYPHLRNPVLPPPPPPRRR